MNKNDEIDNKIRREIQNGDMEDLVERETPADEARRIKDEDMETMKMEEKRYEFNKDRHLHLLDGKLLTGCTTVLSILAKPALISWAAKMAVEYIRENIVKFDITDLSQLEQLLSEAKKAYAKKKETAGDYGTKVHEKISLLISEAITLNKGFVKKDRKCKEKSIQNFIDWAIENKIKFLETEKNVYSEKLWTGGIIDMVAVIDNKTWLIDIKTSGSGIYPENFAQMAGYHLMLNEMGLYPEIAGYIVLNLKEIGEIMEKRSISNEDNIKFFLACLTIYRQQERLKSQTI